MELSTDYNTTNEQLINWGDERLRQLYRIGSYVSSRILDERYGGKRPPVTGLGHNTPANDRLRAIWDEVADQYEMLINCNGTNDSRIRQFNEKFLREYQAYTIEDIVTYFASNEAWFGDDSFVIETSVYDKSDDLNHGVDALIEILGNSGDPIYISVDLTSGSGDKIKEKVDKATSRVYTPLRKIEIVEPISIGRRHEKVEYIPVTLAIGRNNATTLINEIDEQIADNLIELPIDDPILATFRPPEYVATDGVNGVDIESDTARAPFALMFMRQILTQLKYYQKILSERGFQQETAQARLSQINRAVDYFELQVKIKKQLMGQEGIPSLSDGPNDSLNSLLKKMHNNS